MKTLDLPNARTLPWSAHKRPRNHGLQMQLIPLQELLSLRNRLMRDNALFPQYEPQQNYLETLKGDPFMAKLAKDFRPSNFTMEVQSIAYLKEVIEVSKPEVIVELGSGISTPILAGAQAAQYKGTSVTPVYITIDQSQEYLDATVNLCNKAGIGKDALKGLVFPLCNYKAPDLSEKGREEFGCYQFDEQALHDAAGGRTIDMVIIDGPTGGGVSGTDFARMLTAPILSLYAAEKALFFMDDAYRDTEILSFSRWHKMGIVSVAGVKAVGKGLMVAVTP